jgi:hypothetical protein
MEFGTGNVHKNVLGDCGFFEGHKRNDIYACSATFGSEFNSIQFISQSTDPLQGHKEHMDERKTVSHRITYYYKQFINYTIYFITIGGTKN